MRFRFLSILIVTGIFWLVTQGNAWADEAYFIESGGIVSMEAEHYTSNDGYVFMNTNTLLTGTQLAKWPGHWVSVAGFSGSGYMARNKVGRSIHYRIKFTTTGKYYVNLRAWADFSSSGGDAQNGYCPRWNGNEIVSGCPDNGVYVIKRASWQWDTERSIGETRAGAVIVNVPSPGFYTFSIYPKKEWYTWHDKIVLRHVNLCTNNPCPTTPATYNCYGCNSGTGPPESQRSDGPTPPTPTAPTATTGTATGITGETATLNGTVNPNGASTTVVFEYGTTTNYGSTATATQSPLTGSTAQAASAQISGLTAGQTYHYRVKATNSGGIGTGDDRTFAAEQGTPPTATTGAATAVGGESATLNGTVNPNGSSTRVKFDYGTTTDYGSSVPDPPIAIEGSTAQPVSTQVSGLTAGQTYHYRVRAVNSGGETSGDDQTFSTTIPPTVTTGLATSVTSTSAVLNGLVNPNGTSTTAAFEYGTTASYGNTKAATQSPLDGSTAQTVSTVVTGLTPGATYHFRATATNGGGTVTGVDTTFQAIGNNVVIKDVTFAAGTESRYEAATSITFGPGVIVESGAKLVLNAPIVKGVEDVTVKEGGTLKVNIPVRVKEKDEKLVTDGLLSDGGTEFFNN